MSGMNGASDALGLGPFAGYTLNSLITILYVLTVSIGMLYLHVVALRQICTSLLASSLLDL